MANKAHKRISVKKLSSCEDHEFTATLKKKLKSVAVRNRIIQKSLHSLSDRLERRSKSPRTINCSELEKDEVSENTFDFLDYDCSHEIDVPQQQWDDLFESAFTAISNSSVVIFDEPEM